MAEYRAIRKKYSLLEICYHPELAAEVTLQPVRALGVDAAILFADILLPAIPLGLGLEFTKGEGLKIGKPVSSLE
jgi:uroporphyrinogen decarboxylase